MRPKYAACGSATLTAAFVIEADADDMYRMRLDDGAVSSAWFAQRAKRAAKPIRGASICAQVTFDGHEDSDNETRKGETR